MDLRPHIEKFRRRFAEIEAALSDPKAFDNPQRAQELSREYARLKVLAVHGENYLKTLTDLEQNRALLKGEAADSEFAQLAKDEIARLEADEKHLALELQRGLIPPDLLERSASCRHEGQRGKAATEHSLSSGGSWRRGPG